MRTVWPGLSQVRATLVVLPSSTASCLGLTAIQMADAEGCANAEYGHERKAIYGPQMMASLQGQ